MAEAAGLVLGALSLASLFSTCVDAFDQIRAAKAFGRDYQILITRYDIRKTRLLQWGEGVGLLDETRSGRDPRLDQAELQSLLENALNCIRLLLTDTEKLRFKYGLDQNDGKAVGVKEGTSAVTVSQRRVSTFRTSYARFLRRIKEKQNATPLARKAQWAICGADEFRSLITDLDGLIEDLHKLVPVSRRFRSLMVKEDIEALPDDLTTLKLLEEACVIDQAGDASSDEQDPWLEVASQRVQATEMATEDRRNVDEWLAETSAAEIERMDSDSIDEVDTIAAYANNGGLPQDVNVPTAQKDLSDEAKASRHDKRLRTVENKTNQFTRGSGMKKSFRRRLASNDPASYARAKTLYQQHHLGRGAASMSFTDGPSHNKQISNSWTVHQGDVSVRTVHRLRNDLTQGEEAISALTSSHQITSLDGEEQFQLSSSSLPRNEIPLQDSSHVMDGLLLFTSYPMPEGVKSAIHSWRRS